MLLQIIHDIDKLFDVGVGFVGSHDREERMDAKSKLNELEKK